MRRIIICGSMSKYSEMLNWQTVLSEAGIPTIVPAEENDGVKSLTPEKFNIFKRIVSREYLTKIRSNKTYGILVINTTKNSIPNYIGANAFAEIAVAFNAKKKIFILGEYFEDYKDELIAWNATALGCDIEKLIVEFWKTERVMQLDLFENGVSTDIQ